MPFRRVLVKTRASASFTAELKDFVGPFDFFLAPRVQAQTATPYICDKMSVAEITVTNPVATSIYAWSTANGNIISSTSGPVIYVDKPGRYIVTQYLQEGCTAYATDTVDLFEFGFCQVLAANRITDFKGTGNGNTVLLNWKVQDNQQARFFEIQKSNNGVNFTSIGQVSRQELSTEVPAYSFQLAAEKAQMYYRVKLVNADNTVSYSPVYRYSKQSAGNNHQVLVYPNPAKSSLYIQVESGENTTVKLKLYNTAGLQVASKVAVVQKGINTVILDQLNHKVQGMCLLVIELKDEIVKEKVIVMQ
jgi:hypothetical protein